MGDPDKSGPKLTDVTDVLLRLDERLDTLEAENRRLNGRITELSTPIWRNWKALVPIGVVLSVVFGAITWVWNEVPEIAQIVHTKILRSDDAIALSLKNSRVNGDEETLLSQEIENEFREHLAVEDTKTYIADLAKSHGYQTYSASQSYQSIGVPIGRIACLLMAEPEMRDILTETSDAAAAKIGLLDQSCRAPHRGNEVPITDFSPMDVPFNAEPGDLVELVVQVRAFDPTTGSAREDASGILEAFVFEGDEVTFEKLRNNLVRATLKLPPDLKRHVVSINLNKQGKNIVDPTRSRVSTGSAKMVVSLFATIIVKPESES